MIYTYEFRAMGSRIFLAMDSDHDPWPGLGKDIRSNFAGWEVALSRFRADSELSEANRHSGQWLYASDAFWEVLDLSIKMEKQTQGIVTPAILDALEAAGYTTSFEGLKDHPGEQQKQPVKPSSKFRDIELDPANHSFKVPEGLHLDFGGVAKGWAAHQTMLDLHPLGPVLVDAGGDIAISSPMLDDSSWPIGISDPIHPDTNLTTVFLTSGGVATSGRDYRRWQVDGKWQHHLIDPRINRPAQTDVLSATVIADSIVEAEAYSKVMLILGSRETFDRYHDDPRHAFLLVLENGSVMENSHFDSYRQNNTWTTIQNNHSTLKM